MTGFNTCPNTLVENEGPPKTLHTVNQIIQLARPPSSKMSEKSFRHTPGIANIKIKEETSEPSLSAGSRLPTPSITSSPEINATAQRSEDGPFYE